METKEMEEAAPFEAAQTPTPPATARFSYLIVLCGVLFACLLLLEGVGLAIEFFHHGH